MKAAALVGDLQARGVTLVPEGDKLRVRPVSRLSAEELEALREHKAEVLAFLSAPSRPDPDPPRAPDATARREPVTGAPHDPHHVADALPFLGMPLDVFARTGASLEVRVPRLDVTLWLVPTHRDAAQLMVEGIHRGRIWTAAELMQLMAIADRTSETVQTVARAKLELDGEITEVRARENTG